jgi:uncharacterized protein YggU (UPF0235/DUF167 family)
MLIKVKAKPRSKEEYVKKARRGLLRSSCKRGTRKRVEQTQGIVELLSIYFGVKKDRIKLVAGETSKSKLFQILGEERPTLASNLL